jgi:DNA sulfur modification protein DndC
MEAMVENGEEWLEPLLEFRNRLSELQDSALWPSIRKYKRRDGRVKSKDGAPQPWGPYTIETRKDLLRTLLEVQKTVAANNGHEQTELIRKNELEAIRVLWRLEEHDWADSVPQIYRDVIQAETDWIRYETPVFSSEEQDTLRVICDRHELPMEMVAKLIEVERSLQGMSRRSSIQRKLASVFEEDWRTSEELVTSATQQEHQ